MTELTTLLPCAVRCNHAGAARVSGTREPSKFGWRAGTVASRREQWLSEPQMRKRMDFVKRQG